MSQQNYKSQNMMPTASLAVLVLLINLVVIIRHGVEAVL
jgi:hypothetical protein